jgi:uncharacterized membrane protein YqaE (UPF0057 family)
MGQRERNFPCVVLFTAFLWLLLAIRKITMRHTSHGDWTTTTSTSTFDRQGRPLTGPPSTVTGSDIIKIIFAILLPPLGVFFEVGLKGHFWLNILLTLLGYIPGIIHALYVILRH